MSRRSLPLRGHDHAPVEDEPLWRELFSGHWTARARHEDEGGVLLVFGRRPGKSAPLTERQQQALRLAASGLALKLIAGEMKTGISTASTHIGTALERLGVSRADACLLMAACGGDDPVLNQPGLEAAIAVRLDTSRLLHGANLTAAEREVAGFILRGRSNGEIASARRTSARTVANQIAAIFRKVGVSSRAELVARCVGEERLRGRELGV
jgi:DNA-binding CsgD family transcriptional regulator